MRFLPAVAALLALSGCSISQTVTPVPEREVAEICIKQNSAVLMNGFLPTMQRLIEDRGIPTFVYIQSPPERCQHTMDYNARWRWDLAMYLYHAEFRLLENNNVIGRAEYDARFGGARLDKFGTTEEKISPLIDQLLANVRYKPRPVTQPVVAEGGLAAGDDIEAKLRRLKWLRDEHLISDDEYTAKRQQILEGL